MDQKKAKIMVVDDTPANLKLLHQILTAEGYRVFAFLSGSQALKAAEKNPPDLIILDIMMPDMDGFGLCRILKKDNTLNAIPVIFISALNDTQNKIKAFSEGGVDYIAKPFQEEEVLARVSTHLKIVGLQQHLYRHNENLEQLVKERTRELALANTRLVEMTRLKDNFLSMISHELRTPANGLLGLGELLIEGCPENDETKMFASMFRESSQRMRNLIEDAELIVSMDMAVCNGKGNILFPELMAEVEASLPEISMDMTLSPSLSSRILHMDRDLLQKTMTTLMCLAASFSKNRQCVKISVTDTENGINLTLPMDTVMLSQNQAASFFDLPSPVRGASQAQELGLAPVVAHRVIETFGGSLHLVKTGELSGEIRGFLPYPKC
ncbi:phospho-acceptor domain-containing protein [Desulfobotulus alkaliphilus]|uniref:histidine kinase n=1 Tax=Desulfobotulus alkaliphilus TaxID=622671 RepID=A0A562S030_9BACT|nr:response regulator [Desulfobotulus alkaliphilus]TWI74164.1 phospho-acceptor domain-containing protein [Desulfobotulus alkaliphilus]